MNLNEYLCSKFKPNKKGKVTVGHLVDFVIKLTIIVIVSSLLIILLGGLMLLACESGGVVSESDLPQSIIDGEVIPSILFFLAAGFIAVIFMGILLALVIGFLVVGDWICAIPVASCGVVEEKDKKQIEGESNDKKQITGGKEAE